MIQQNEDLKVVYEAVVCDSKTTCPPMSTCCLMIHGEYGCCPYDDGVCCGTHCCPHNSKCGKDIGQCIESEEIEDSFEEHESIFPELNWHTIEISAYPTKNKNKILNPVCPGSEIPCQNGTCCQVSADSSYACCKVF